MSWRTDANKRFGYIKKARTALGKAFQALNSAIYTAVLEQAIGLRTDAGGKITTSVYNIAHANNTGLYVNSRIARESTGILDLLINGMKRLFGLNTEYFGNMSDIRDAEAEVLYKVFLTYGYDVRGSQLIPGGYLAASLSSNPAAAQIVKLMQDAINAKMTLHEFRRTFKAFFAPPGQAGAIERHFMRWTHDFYQQFDRTSQLEYKNELGFKYAIYAGTIVDDSREFCMQRNNVLYTEPEIIKWNALDWTGKIPGQDVRVACGGYNCRHSLNWISDEVAKTLIDRGFNVDTYR